MAKEKRPKAERDGERAGAQQFAGPDHRTPSLVAMDSPDDPQLGSPREQAGRNRGGADGRGTRAD